MISNHPHAQCTRTDARGLEEDERTADSATAVSAVLWASKTFRFSSAPREGRFLRFDGVVDLNISAKTDNVIELYRFGREACAVCFDLAFDEDESRGYRRRRNNVAQWRSGPMATTSVITLTEGLDEGSKEL